MDQKLRRKLDRITDILWAGGVTNPVTYIEQISYLIYLKLLDEEESSRELRGVSAPGTAPGSFPVRPSATAGRSGASRAGRICATSYATRSSPTWPRS